MVGIGETDEEIIEVMGELLDAGCQILTIGQYLAPTQTQTPSAGRTFFEPRRI